MNLLIRLGRVDSGDLPVSVFLTWIIVHPTTFRFYVGAGIKYKFSCGDLSKAPTAFLAQFSLSFLTFISQVLGLKSLAIMCHMKKGGYKCTINLFKSLFFPLSHPSFLRETESYHVNLDDLKCAMWTKMSSHSKRQPAPVSVVLGLKVWLRILSSFG